VQRAVLEPRLVTRQEPAALVAPVAVSMKKNDFMSFVCTW
jgi:hypothetical protein